MGARKDLYDFIKTNGLKTYSREALKKVAKIEDWARALRQLSQDGIIEYEYSKGSDTYLITSIEEYSSSSKRAGLSSKDRYRIRNRDGHRCQACGKGVNDGVKLHVDHKIPLDWGGSNLDDNLWTLCNACNLGKKSFFKDDFNPEIMKAVYKETSGYKRLKVLFELSPNKEFPPSIIQGIAGIRDWTRTLRDIRKKHNLNLVWFKPTDEFPNGYYSNIE